MTAPRTPDVITATATIPPATPVARDQGTRLLRKVHAIRPMLVERESRKKVDELPRTN